MKKISVIVKNRKFVELDQVVPRGDCLYFSWQPVKAAFFYFFLLLILSSCTPTSQAGSPAPVKAEECENLVACHRCGMEMINTDQLVQLDSDMDESWAECCVPCAVLDIIELTGKNGVITAFDDFDQTKITLVVKDGRIQEMRPADTVLLVGGSCVHNKIFSSRVNSERFTQQQEWATLKMIKTVPATIAKLGEKAQSLKYCAFCGSHLKDAVASYFSIMTDSHRRFVFCGPHCGIFAAHQLEMETKYVVSRDYSSGNLFNAHRGFYLLGSSYTRGYRSTVLSFVKQDQAQSIQHQYGGEIFSFIELEKRLVHSDG